MRLPHNKMKITKVEYHENDGILTIWTDVDPNVGFNFNVDDVTNSNDLKAQVKIRADEYLVDQQAKAAKKTKAETFKSLEGKEI